MNHFLPGEKMEYPLPEPWVDTFRKAGIPGWRASLESGGRSFSTKAAGPCDVGGREGGRDSWTRVEVRDTRGGIAADFSTTAVASGGVIVEEVFVDAGSAEESSGNSSASIRRASTSPIVAILSFCFTGHTMRLEDTERRIEVIPGTADCFFGRTRWNAFKQPSAPPWFLLDFAPRMPMPTV